MTREFGSTPERKNLGKFLEGLWTLSSQNLSGETTRVLRLPVVDKDERVYPPKLLGPLPEIDIAIKPQIDKNFDNWLEISSRLLVDVPSKRKKLKLTLWEKGINILSVPLFLGTRDNKDVILFLKYSSMVGVAHPESQRGAHFSPQAEEGTPGVRFRITEIFTDSRRKVQKIYNSLIEDVKKRDFDHHVRASVMETGLSTTKPVGELLTKLDSSLLTFMELVGRVTFYDTGRKVYQPINLVGFQVIETLDGSIYANRLDAPSGYDSWKPLPPATEAEIGIDYTRNLSELDKSLSILANVLRQPNH